ncbi:coiled-coil domain-containing protein 137 [Frankliniella occidentalis]|uniref:Coiled-coil domain-containing protein 137 n=1 Tax=Frankliniella occidentalis TaxID=133901 RepID=A0A6J1TPW0_FRAOC|nr:coiled-coil domain-containing protein 137 [Frankliniella occidentalis]
MGRKIPVRKHKGVNDPEKQKRVRDAKVKNLINNPPSANDDSEPLPKSLQEIMRLRQMVKEGKFNNKKKRKNKKKKDVQLNVEGKPLLDSSNFIGPPDVKQSGMKRPEKPIPTIQQRAGEKDRTFLYRVQQLCEDVIKEVKFEKKYKVDVVRNEETGQIENLQKKKKDDVDEMLKAEAKKARDAANPKKRRKSKKKEAEEAAAKEEKLRKRKDRRKIKREKVKQKVLAKNEDKIGNIIRETVKFGDVADRPPEIKVKPRKAIADRNVANLMFNQMIINGKALEKEMKEKHQDLKSQNGKPLSKPSLKGKRKDLPVAQRLMLEEQQKSVIAAYRLMKAKKEKLKATV